MGRRGAKRRGRRGRIRRGIRGGGKEEEENVVDD